jgi:hypothetical protein
VTDVGLEKRSEVNQYDECANDEQNIDADNCDAKTGASHYLVRAELWPAGERLERSMQSVHHAFIKPKAGDFVPANLIKIASHSGQLQDSCTVWN